MRRYSWELSFKDINTSHIPGNNVRPNTDSTISSFEVSIWQSYLTTRKVLQEDAIPQTSFVERTWFRKILYHIFISSNCFERKCNASLKFLFLFIFLYFILYFSVILSSQQTNKQTHNWISKCLFIKLHSLITL